jgi:hypothetical protein
MNAMLEPRMVTAEIHGPFATPGWEHGLVRIAASSQGGLAMVAMRLLSAGSPSVGSTLGRFASLLMFQDFLSAVLTNVMVYLIAPKAGSAVILSDALALSSICRRCAICDFLKNAR